VNYKNVPHAHIVRSIIEHSQASWQAFSEGRGIRAHRELEKVNKGLEILLAIMNAEEKGLFETAEHLMSSIDLGE